MLSKSSFSCSTKSLSIPAWLRKILCCTTFWSPELQAMWTIKRNTWGISLSFSLTFCLTCSTSMLCNCAPKTCCCVLLSSLYCCTGVELTHSKSLTNGESYLHLLDMLICVIMSTKTTTKLNCILSNAKLLAIITLGSKFTYPSDQGLKQPRATTKEKKHPSSLDARQ